MGRGAGFSEEDAGRTGAPAPPAPYKAQTAPGSQSAAALPHQLLSASPACGGGEEAGPRHPQCRVSPREILLQSRQNLLPVSTDIWGFEFLEKGEKGVYKTTKHGVYSFFRKNRERASGLLGGQVLAGAAGLMLGLTPKALLFLGLETAWHGARCRRHCFQRGVHSTMVPSPA